MTMKNASTPEGVADVQVEEWYGARTLFPFSPFLRLADFSHSFVFTL